MGWLLIVLPAKILHLEDSNTIQPLVWRFKSQDIHFLCQSKPRSIWRASQSGESLAKHVIGGLLQTVRDFQAKAEPGSITGAHVKTDGSAFVFVGSILWENPYNQ